MWGSVGWADRPPPSPANLDGLYLTVGPLGGATRVEGAWTTGAGAELSLVRVTERCLPAALGIAAGGVGYTSRAGGRLWLEAEAAIGRPLPVAVGLGLGTAAEVDAVRPARFGAQATLWLFTGILPYLRAGAVQGAGAFVEAGIMIKIPAIKLFSY